MITTHTGKEHNNKKDLPSIPVSLSLRVTHSNRLRYIWFLAEHTRNQTFHRRAIIVNWMRFFLLFSRSSFLLLSLISISYVYS